MPLSSRQNLLRVAPQFQPIFREIGLDAEAIFEHPLIQPWRKLSDRENCTLDVTLADGTSIRWHIKRYPRLAMAAMGKSKSPAETEMDAYALLKQKDIPTATVVGWGKLRDGRSFVITEDLADHDAADKLIRTGQISFEQILAPTADLAARLHNAGLHHRDLYLCHFFVSTLPLADSAEIDVRLIDVARVRTLPLLTRRRWVVKDLAQFWFSTLEHPSITSPSRMNWLKRYTIKRGLEPTDLYGAIERKSNSIARHDQQLRRAQPNRNISIPTPE